MKVRIGFVSNSSSASFVVSKSDITAEQLDKIRNHSAVAKRDFADAIDYPGDSWNIREDEDSVRGFTIMDNFDMGHFLRLIGVDMEKVDIGDEWWFDEDDEDIEVDEECD